MEFRRQWLIGFTNGDDRNNKKYAAMIRVWRMSERGDERKRNIHRKRGMLICSFFVCVCVCECVCVLCISTLGIFFRVPLYVRACLFDTKARSGGSQCAVAAALSPTITGRPRQLQLFTGPSVVGFIWPKVAQPRPKDRPCVL